MIALWMHLAASAADPETERLLGADGTEFTPRMASAPGPVGGALMGLWPLGIAIVGAGALWTMSRVKRLEPAPGPVHVDVVGRATLHANNVVQVIDVEDAAGKTRRLLVATGTGAPSLIADLGAAPAGSVGKKLTPETVTRLVDETVPATDRRRWAAASAAAEAETDADEQIVARLRSSNRAPSRPPSTPPPENKPVDRRAAALGLIDEVIGRAGRGGGVRA